MSNQNNLLISNTNENPVKKNRKKNLQKRTTIIMSAAIIILFILCVSLIFVSYKIKVDAAKNAYNEFKSESESFSYEKTGQKLFELGEKRYHTSNKISISIDGIEKIPYLEPLKVKEIDYYIHTSDKNIKSEAWYKIIGEGTFTVNMELAQIITDEDRNYILIKIPSPTLQSDDFNVNVEEFHFDKKGFETTEKGEELAAIAQKEGYKNIKKKILENQYYYNFAKNSAKSQLIELAKKCNPEIDVIVDVEFFD